MRILTIIPALHIGGAQYFFIRLSLALSKRHEVTAFIEHPGTANPVLLEQLRAGGVEVCSTPFTTGPVGRVASHLNQLGLRINERLNLVWRAEIAALRSLHRKRHFQIINPHLTWPELSAARAFYNDPVRIVATDHGDYRLGLFHQMAAQPRYRRWFERTDAMAFPSRNNAATVKGIPRKPGFDSRVIYYGHVPPVPSRIERPPGAGLVFGVAARGIPEKGWAEALAAFVKAADRLPADSHLMLVGGGPAVEAAKLAAAAVPEKLRGRIHFAGPQGDPSPWMAGFDCGVLPSYYPAESLPNFIIECLALGRPVLATPIGGVPEMLTTDHGTAGHLVGFDASGKPDIDQLASAMVRFGTEPETRDRWARTAVIAARRFDMDECVARYEELFAPIRTPV